MNANIPLPMLIASIFPRTPEYFFGKEDIVHTHPPLPRNAKKPVSMSPAQRLRKENRTASIPFPEKTPYPLILFIFIPEWNSNPFKIKFLFTFPTRHE